MNTLLLFGGGGHCLTVIDALCACDYDKIGIVDNEKGPGQKLQGIPVVGCDAEISHLRAAFDCAFISFGGINLLHKRRILAKRLEALAFDFPIIIHGKSSVSTGSDISAGVLIGAMAVVNAACKVGRHCILNTGCIIEHNCIVEPFAHIAPRAVLCGNVKIGAGSHIGAGSVIREGVSIGANTIIGMGAIVTKNMPDNVVAYGNPCEVVRINPGSDASR